ncbi:MAG: hypothetical protein A2729_05180 [Candidatus Buchananbacteria bacterium RIFCSPHIGHO2_01_FULL_39_14]|uniref:Nucleoside 2-deoxyribosyltransferase n=2 Tax=Candidatus Buchananiibacteriota TaxID=1817903 RepID=A0A1G1YRL6_9BACT|nr:MAG: hypothetical protein A2729_05180 [Candidatus Buchananbacteria bacterium RIFCSPHIGHO2_01_FULL_39_14]OGY48104.1 MAG: hypothetical protein A3D39_03550 [Candidatus Buchananbacteria bacterium RIFCSPHIGHO2_02_FULL_39_17]OGY54456.1 MAG: hypothetical protein A2912_05685 [Candidatus Buchananbacteria bacterium RIFCSPLOWO2_01_FULL_40_23b]
MRIYFAADNQAEERLQKRFSDIIEVLSNAGVLVSSNLADKNLVNFSSQDLEKISQAGETILEKMDGLVIEETKSLAESGYLIALALAHKKPILYLLEKGKTVNKNLLHLKNDKSITKLLNLKNYTEKDLEQIILEFLGEVEKGEGKQLPNIKFTLRVTSRIERYLHWKTHNTKLSKADFLRELIKKLIDQDEDYKKFSNQRRED